MIRLYLDTSVFNRPFDDQSQVKIFLETQATISVLRTITEQTVELMSSTVLQYENRQNPSPIKRAFMQAYLDIANFQPPLNQSVIQRAATLKEQGIQLIDSLHIASAEVSACDYVLTCDKRLINRCQNLALKVLNPVNYILEIEDESSSE